MRLPLILVAALAVTACPAEKAPPPEVKAATPPAAPARTGKVTLLVTGHESGMLPAKAPRLLARLHAALDAVESWDTGVLEDAVRSVAEEAEVKLGQVAQPLRAALTGRRTSPGIFDVLELLGRDESLGRIADRMAA